MQDPKLTPTSYIVLGLLELSGESTPYELKQAVRLTLGNFWSLQHAQLYSEPQRLAEAGYVKERREEGGRRRRHYTITAKGRKALEEWRQVPSDRTFELRDLGLLKVFFGADPVAVAESQIHMHRRKLAELEGLQSLDVGSDPRGPWTTLEAGLRHTRESISFWEDVASRSSKRRR